MIEEILNYYTTKIESLNKVIQLQENMLEKNTKKYTCEQYLKLLLYTPEDILEDEKHIDMLANIEVDTKKLLIKLINERV